mmetsp:Transcript_45106/g.107244  ORF Transcript_45106/g.107244 Transcript_45106/m.107244 type:complete len:327 (-) Transcript_45106:95-1075(-)
MRKALQQAATGLTLPYRASAPALHSRSAPVYALASSSSASPFRSDRRYARKYYTIERVRYPFKMQLLKDSWELLKADMVAHFQNQPVRNSTVHIRAEPWPRFTMKERLLEEDRLPAIIAGSGPQRRIHFNQEEMTRIAFDEPQGHLSHLFKGRLFRIYVEDWIEECVVEDVATHAVEQELHFVRFRRHVPGKLSEVSIPVTLAGLWGCPGYHAGGHVDLAMPTIDCECVGEHIPPPFIVDVSKLELEEPYSKITLRDIKDKLPQDGLTRFSRNYTLEEEVVMCYRPKAIGETPLPDDYEDPNFYNRGGKRLHLTYTGFWPKQSTRS